MRRALPPPSPSPFQAGRRLNAGELVDRTSEVEQVARALIRGDKLFMIGPRRHGKTSILNVAAGHAEADGIAVLAFDAEAFPTAELLAAHILAEATRRLEPAVERAQAAATRFFGRLRPSVTFNPADGAFTVSLGLDAPAAGGAVPLLADVLDGVDRWAASSGRRVAVIIDEIQEVLEREGESAERQLRAAVQRHEHVGYVFAGSRTHYLRRLTSDPSAAFFNLGARLYIGEIPDDDFREWLASSFASGGFDVAPGAIEAILELAERVPYNVQLLADTCWRALAARARGKGGSLTADDVQGIANDWVRSQDPIYSPQWVQLTTAQRTALQVLVHERTGFTSQAILRQYRMTASAMQRALSGLTEKGITFDEQREGQSRLRLQDPFFGLWVKVFTVAPAGSRELQATVRGSR